MHESKTAQYNRRTFIKTGMAAGLTTAVMPEAGEAAEPEWRNRQEGMIYRRLGRTNMMISRVTMAGSSSRGGPGHVDHLRVALDLGFNYIDTAPQYKTSEAGFTMSFPAYFGAVPCVASNKPTVSDRLAPGAMPMPPTCAASASER